MPASNPGGPDREAATEQYREAAPGYDRYMRRFARWQRMAVERLELESGETVIDVASFVAHLVEQGDDFVGERIAIASDELTGIDAAETLARVTGRGFEFEHVPLDRLNPPMRRLFEWLDRVRESADPGALRRDYPDVGWHSFQQWATMQKWPTAKGVAGNRLSPLDRGPEAGDASENRLKSSSETARGRGPQEPEQTD